MIQVCAILEPEVSVYLLLIFYHEHKQRATPPTSQCSAPTEPEIPKQCIRNKQRLHTQKSEKLSSICRQLSYQNFEHPEKGARHDKALATVVHN